MNTGQSKLPPRVWCLVALSLASSNIVLAQTSSSDTVLIIPHTHWEGAVFKTREEYLEVGLPNILKALYLLKKYPNYRFVLDQMCYVRPFLRALSLRGRRLSRISRARPPADRGRDGHHARQQHSVG